MLAIFTMIALGLLFCSPVAAFSWFFELPNLHLGANALFLRDASNTTITECGHDAAPGNETCPLNVCCSEYGNCGTTADFCAIGCQSGCDEIARPSCEDSVSSMKRTVGYYESWANTRKCQSVSPEDLNVTGFTHINYGFLLFDPMTFAIASADDNSTSLIARFTNLKTTNPGLQTWVAIGGWNFNEPGPTATAFSDMVSCAENRTKFINELTHFMDTYAFDGLDLDWEYPSASDRGGKHADKENYVSLTKDLRAVFGTKYGLSVTLPASYYYMQNFDVAGMEEHVDFFNIMSYDLHGVWDKETKGVGPYIRPHTNISEIEGALDLLWRAKVAPEKVTMGMAGYGRSFTLQDANCTTPNGVCQFSEAGLAGPCSDAKGMLDLQEIQDILAEGHLTPTLDKAAAIKYTAYNSTQWVAYDDDETIRMKQAFAGSRCLGGTMVWAMDQADQKSACGLPAAVRSSAATNSTAPSNRTDGAVSNCSSQVQVAANTTTWASIVAASAGNFTSAQLKAWNPSLLSSCSALKPGQTLCTSPPGGWYVFAPPPLAVSSGGRADTSISASGSASSSGSRSPSTSTSGTGTTSPPPKTQPGISPDCNKFATATSGDTCISFAAANGIEPAQLYAWNPVLGVDGKACATALCAEESYCVGIAATGASMGDPSSSSASSSSSLSASSSSVMSSSSAASAVLASTVVAENVTVTVTASESGASVSASSSSGEN